MKNNIIKFNCWKKNEFLDELKNGIDFYFEDILINNIEEFFKFCVKKKLKKIVLHKFENNNIDVLLVRKCNKFITRYNKEFLDIDMKFEGFDQDEICILISKELFALYCIKYNIAYIKNDELIKSEKAKLDKYSKKLDIYKEFKIIKKFHLENNRYTYFNFPVENGVDRFVFYFLINTEYEKKEIIELFNQINFNKKCIKVFKNVCGYKYSGLYAIGFNYKNEILDRTTLYSRFNKYYSRDENDLFLMEKFKISNELKNNLSVKDWGIDVFRDNSECFKIYFEKFNFKALNKNELNRVLDKKPCVGCYKIINNKINDKKYEFSNNLFSEKEIIILEKLKIFNKESKLFSIYLDDKEELKNSVRYNI